MPNYLKNPILTISIVAKLKNSIEIQRNNTRLLLVNQRTTYQVKNKITF